MKAPPEHLHKQIISQIDREVEKRDDLLAKLVKAELKLKDMRRTAARLKKRVRNEKRMLREARAEQAAQQP